ncbi:MAG: acetate--CoA ligase family protein [Desulfatirhabdiaceae bacterium]|nr:acetate--CoA ligase family protein [Desulfatirhabdiaceae bacterium]
MDAIFLHLFAGGFSLNFDLSPLVASVISSGKPMVAWLIGKREQALEMQIAIQKQGIPVFREIQRAVECLRAVFKRNKRETPWHASVESFEQCTVSRKWKQIPAMPSSCLDEHVSKLILSDFGIPAVPERIVGSLSEAKAAAADFGFPVVMKGITPGVVHKTEQGLVKIGIHSNEMVETAFSDLCAAMPIGGSILVQQQVPGSVELIAGFLRDPQFGPCVMLGLGGIFAEALEDTAFAVAPVSRKDAFHLMDQIRAQKVLNGFRNSVPVNRDALSDILIHLGGLGLACQRIQEIDINPLIVFNGNPIAVDASIQLTTTEKP